MTTPITAQLHSYRSTLGLAPEQGPMAMDLALNFASDNSFTKNFMQELAALKLDFIQSVFIDNSASGIDFTIAVDGSIYTITVAGGSQGIYPLSLPAGAPTLIFSKPVAENSTVNLIFFNHILPFIRWNT